MSFLASQCNMSRSHSQHIKIGVHRILVLTYVHIYLYYHGRCFEDHNGMMPRNTIFERLTSQAAMALFLPVRLTTTGTSLFQNSLCNKSLVCTPRRHFREAYNLELVKSRIINQKGILVPMSALYICRFASPDRR